MNDEIKEILKTMKTFNGNLIVENTEVTTLCLTKKESKLLLDYITNLQQKVEQYENPDDLTLFYMWLDEKAKDKIKELQQKIDKAIEYIEKHSNSFSVLDTISNGELLDILKGDSND